MSKAKEVKQKEESKPLPRAPFLGVSRFSGGQNQFSGPKFNQRGFANRPFVTQHKGGGGK